MTKVNQALEQEYNPLEPLPLSEQQAKVIRWLTSGVGSANVIARAGCGKTYLLLAAAEEIRRLWGSDVRVFMGAFNRSIADEIGEKLQERNIYPPQVMSSTWHSFGLGALRKIAPDVKIDNSKVWKIIDEKGIAEKYFVSKLVSLAKQAAIKMTVDEWYEIIDHFDLESIIEYMPDTHHVSLEEGQKIQEDYVWSLIQSAIWVYLKSAETIKEVVDFDDMILAPIILNLPLSDKDFVLLDEAQDTNEARRLLALKALKPEGRLIAVGDPKQAIYGFTGADSNAMDLIKGELGSIEFPLTLTYRCPKQVVKLANQWVPDISAHDSAPEGLVTSIPYHEPNPCREIDVSNIKGCEDLEPQSSFFDLTLQPSDIILCRNTAPLVSLAFRLIRDGVGCKIEGRDIGKGLIQLANRWKTDSLDELETRLRDYKEREVSRALSKNQTGKAAGIEDKVDTLSIIIDQLLLNGESTKSALRSRIEKIFGDTKNGGRELLTLSTIHKAKGKEWDRVYLLGRNAYMPSKYAKQGWELGQEDNLCYVAVTRAKRELIEVIV